MHRCDTRFAHDKTHPTLACLFILPALLHLVLPQNALDRNPCLADRDPHRITTPQHTSNTIHTARSYFNVSFLCLPSIALPIPPNHLFACLLLGLVLHLLLLARFQVCSRFFVFLTLFLFSRDLWVILILWIFVCCPRIWRIAAYSPFLRISGSGRMLRILWYSMFSRISCFAWFCWQVDVDNGHDHSEGTPPRKHGLSASTPTLPRGMADLGWLGAHRYPLHPPPRPHDYPCTHITPLHATTLYNTLTPSTRHVKIVFPKYSSQSQQQTHAYLECRVWIPNPGALPIIASVSPQPIPCLFACFYESVSYVYDVFSTCLSSCVASAAWFVFGFVFIATSFLSSFFYCEFNTYFKHSTLVIRMTLLICLSSFSICMFIILIPANVYLNMYTDFPPLPYSYTFIALFICVVCVMVYTYNRLCLNSSFFETW